MNRFSFIRYARKFNRSAYRFCCDKSDKPPGPSASAKDLKTDDAKEASKKKIEMLLKAMIAESKNGPKPKQDMEELAKPPGIFHRPKVVVQKEDIEQKLVDAVPSVAEAIGGPDTKQTEAELLSKVLGKINPSQSQVKWNDLIVGMNVDTSQGADVEFKRDKGARDVRRFAERARGFTDRHDSMGHDFTFKKRTFKPIAPVEDKIFGIEPLGIFKTSDTTNYGTKLEVWDLQFEREIKLSVQRAPENYFEKMIMWTEEGKIWKFPIDNEQGLDSDQATEFTEHIFLDVHLEGWCPETGPIRHFMELVCVGLSKNPYYTVQEKKDHLNWFKEYFTSREKLLIEVGAMPKRETVEENKI